MSAGRPAARHFPKPWSQQRPKGQRLQAGGRHATVRAFQAEEHAEGQGPQANGQRDTFPLTAAGPRGIFQALAEVPTSDQLLQAARRNDTFR